jgi:DNA-binding Lrp family transcriptional regulator
MKGVPSAVRKAFERLRRESSGGIYLKLINGKHYVYKESGRWDREAGKSRVKSEYLGRILEDGTYVKKISSYSDELERAKALIAEKGGKITWAEREGGGALLPREAAKAVSDETDLKLLTALSMNARASSASIGRIVGLSATATYNRIKNLEKRFGIRYLAELDLEKLGYLTYIVTIKFLREVPTQEQLEETLRKDPRIQLAFLTKGDYDLILFIVMEAEGERARLIMGSERELLFPKHDARWYNAPIYSLYSFIPLREEFLGILGQRVWTRSKGSPNPPEGSISQSEFAVLSELSKNGTADFSKIDAKYGFDKGRTQYAYHKLRTKGIVKRVTMTMTDLPLKYLAVLYVEDINDAKWEANKPALLSHTIKDTASPTNHYVFAGDTGIPNGTLFVLPVFRDEDLKNTEGEISSIIEDARISDSFVIKCLVGAPCFRKFDNRYSKQHAKLASKYGLAQAGPKIEYD